VALFCVMHLTHLSLTNFRNYARLDVEVPRGPLLLLGGNAQGKTSLLEAIYFLATFVSFNTSNDRQLINFIAAREPLAVARIKADFRYDANLDSDRSLPVHSAGEEHQMEVRIIKEGSGSFNGSARVRKEVLIDGVKRKLTDALGVFNAVLFLPQMLQIVEGAPEERRRYLNLTLSQAVPNYADTLSSYSRSLAQRNALLKSLSERGGDPQQLSYWDEQIASTGAQIIYARIHAILELERLAARIHSELTRGQEILRIDYQPAYDPLPKRSRQYELPLNTPVDRSGVSLEKIHQGFLADLARLRSEEIARGVTTIGPHRDEMRFLGNGIDLGDFGSRGQARTAVLSMKLAEVAWMKGRTGRWPVLLLDEVLAELDPARRKDLLDRLASSEQALLTTTDLDLFHDEFVNRASLWQIQGGRLGEMKNEVR
jgi:DNA replication and repair protein RecF